MTETKDCGCVVCERCIGKGTAARNEARGIGGHRIIAMPCERCNATGIEEPCEQHREGEQ